MNSSATISSQPAGLRQGFTALLDAASDALAMWPPLWINSIFGPPTSWIPPFNYYSEFTIVDLWRLRRTVKYLANVTVPSLPRTPIAFMPPFLRDLFWQPTVILQRPDHYGSYTSYPDEHWFFINGIMTDDEVAQINAAYLTYLFHRPVTLIQNSTDSLWLDLLECSLGKEWFLNTESATKAFPAIYDALKSEKKKVVVICHSQGTIIMAVVLHGLKSITQPGTLARTLASEYAGPEFVYPDEMELELSDFEPLTEAELAKLEIYAFANCATEMTYYRPAVDGALPIPYIENFGNENDIVARLGMLAPRAAQRGICVDGPVYEHFGAWGHFLNQHYLLPMEARQKDGRKRKGAGGARPFRLVKGHSYPDADIPRIYSYINGGSPEEQ